MWLKINQNDGKTRSGEDERAREREIEKKKKWYKSRIIDLESYDSFLREVADI